MMGMWRVFSVTAGFYLQPHLLLLPHPTPAHSALQAQSLSPFPPPCCHSPPALLLRLLPSDPDPKVTFSRSPFPAILSKTSTLPSYCPPSLLDYHLTNYVLLIYRVYWTSVSRMGASWGWALLCVLGTTPASVADRAYTEWVLGR